MRKKRILLIAALTVLLFGTVAGITYAALRVKTATDKTISTSSLGVQLYMNDRISSSDDVSYDWKDNENGKIKEIVYAKNEGTADLYLRIKINRAWYENSKKITNRMNQEIDSNAIEINFINTEDWLVSENTQQNQNDIYIYYKRKLSPSEKTSVFMNEIKLLNGKTGNTNEYADLSAKLAFSAEAVQTVAADKAISKEWGITPEFDSEGNLIGINNN